MLRLPNDDDDGAAFRGPSRSASCCPGEIVPGQPSFYRATRGRHQNGFTPVIQARTMPLPGTPNVRFAVVGDLGTTNDSISTVQHVLQGHQSDPVGFGALLLVGDHSYAGKLSVWGLYGRIVESVARVMPLEREPVAPVPPFPPLYEYALMIPIRPAALKMAPALARAARESAE